MASTPYHPPTHRGPSVPHRSKQLIVVDKPSGLLSVPGRGAKAQRELSILFQKRRGHKRYQALVEGHWTAATTGKIAQPISADWPSRPKRKVDHKTGQPCLTRYRLLDIDAARAVSRIELEPITGRSHQLPGHMEAMGRPILGDDFYGTPASCTKAECLMLHACRIEFSHPETGVPLRID